MVTSKFPQGENRLHSMSLGLGKKTLFHGLDQLQSLV